MEEFVVPYDELDPRCVPLVKFFNDRGLKTFSSCQGHGTHEQSLFYVSFDSMVAPEDLIKFQKRHLNGRGDFVSCGHFVQRLFYSVYDADKDADTGKVYTFWEYCAASPEVADYDLENWLYIEKVNTQFKSDAISTGGVQQINLCDASKVSTVVGEFGNYDFDGFDLKHSSCTRLDAASYMVECVIGAAKYDFVTYFLKGTEQFKCMPVKQQGFFVVDHFLKTLNEELASEDLEGIEAICQMANEQHTNLWSLDAHDFSHVIPGQQQSPEEMCALCKYYTVAFEDGEYGLNPWRWMSAFGVRPNYTKVPSVFDICSGVELPVIDINVMAIANRLMSYSRLGNYMFSWYEDNYIHASQSNKVTNLLFLAECYLFLQSVVQDCFEYFTFSSNPSKASYRVLYKIYDISKEAGGYYCYGAAWRESEFQQLKRFVARLNTLGIEAEIRNI